MALKKNETRLGAGVRPKSCPIKLQDRRQFPHRARTRECRSQYTRRLRFDPRAI